MVLTPVIPSLPQTYEINQVVTDGPVIVVHACSRRREAACPRCGTLSRQLHGCRVRQLWEQPSGGKPVRVRLTVHRFVCGDRTCRQRTFAEPLTDLARRHAQRTQGQAQAVEAVALALGGQAGSRLARRLGLAGASASTLLRALRRASRAEPPEPRVVGIDDWAWRRGDRYGSIVVDLQRGEVLDLLDTYSVQALAGWLAQHPGIEVVVRDRGPIGIQAARQGAPQAVQVADRFHLLHNLTEQLAAGLKRHPWRRESEASSDPAAASLARAAAEAAGTPSHSQECYAQLQSLRAAGWSIRAMAQQVQMARATVHRWLTHGPPCADWGRTVRQRASPHTQPTRPALPGPRQLGGWFVRDPETLSRAQREQLHQVLGQSPDLQSVYQLAQRFVRLLQERDEAALRPWLAEALACPWSQLREVARGLQRDLAAVQAALRLPYSNGPVEGQITRLKLLKRQAYGRASVSMLRQRLQLA